jgi:hypothetical protein
MHVLKSGLLATALVSASIAANAQSVTYDFTGIVTSSDYGSVSTGMTITGTYTINLANSDLSSDGFSDNSISYNGQPWTRGVSNQYSPTFNGRVFSATETIGALTFGVSPPSPFGSTSQLTGGYGFYGASDYEYSTSKSYMESAFSLSSTGNPTYPFTLGGLPSFGAGTLGTGSLSFAQIVASANGAEVEFGPQIDYSISSLKEVAAPEIDSAAAMSAIALILGGLAVLRGRRVTAAA